MLVLVVGGVRVPLRVDVVNPDGGDGGGCYGAGGAGGAAVGNGFPVAVYWKCLYCVA